MGAERIDNKDMNPSLSVFLDFSLPNATTWFYFSWLLAVALFFKFSRLLSVRNWDVVTVFLLVPGLLLIQGTRCQAGSSGRASNGIGWTRGGHGPGVPTVALWFGNPSPHPALSSGGRLWWGYLWLMCGSAYLFLRCLLDLTLVQRPALPPNLNFGGLFWLAGAAVGLSDRGCLSRRSEYHPTPPHPHPAYNKAPPARSARKARPLASCGTNLERSFGCPAPSRSWATLPLCSV